jgi:hypothetical protein
MMRIVILSLLIVVCASVSWAQWEEISPIPGRDVASITPYIADSAGIWCCVCSYPSFDCNYFAYGLKPYYSSDGGDTWELRDNGMDSVSSIGRVEICPTNPDLLSAYNDDNGRGDPYRSMDRGLTWQHSDSGLTLPGIPRCSRVGWFPDGVHAYCISLSNNGDRGYFLSADTGLTWQFTRYLAVFLSAATPPTAPGMILLTDDELEAQPTTGSFQSWMAA